MEFQVASIKPVEPPKPPHGVTLAIHQGTATFTAATLRQMIAQAYQVQRVRVVGGPAWCDSEHYDVIAKAASPDATPDRIRQMLQALLANRFKLTVQREKKEMSMYALVVGKSGPKIQEAAAGEKTDFQPGNPGQIVFRKQPIAAMVGLLANVMDTPVEDMTGLKGLYDYKLEWTPDPNSTRPPDPRDFIPEAVENLGMKMEARKAPIEVLAVDRAEKASPN